eukprot:Gb_14488 [translate_table: standard]
MPDQYFRLKSKLGNNLDSSHCEAVFGVMDSNICQESTIMQSLLPVPALDAQRDKILTKVCQEGGFAYVPLVMRAATGDVHAAEAAHDMAWEQLHSAPWHSVEPVWRDAYSLSCLHMASSHHRAGKFKEALRVLDMGLIMGGPLLRPDLNSAISLLQSTQTSMVNNCEGTKGVFIDAEIGNASIQGTDKIEENEDKGNLSNCLRQCYVPGGPVPHKCIGLWSKQGAASSKEQPPYQGKKEVPNLDVLDQQESRNKMPAEFCLSEVLLYSEITLTVEVGFAILSLSSSEELCIMYSNFLVLQGLPRRSFCSKLIENWPMLSLEDFLCRFFLPGAPVIITGAMSHWPALTKWKDMEYLKTAVGNRTVPVEDQGMKCWSEWESNQEMAHLVLRCYILMS